MSNHPIKPSALVRWMLALATVTFAGAGLALRDDPRWFAAGSTADTRPSLDDTIRLLESHLANPTARKIDINSAVRLEEIYRTAKKDAARASEVIRKVRDRYPDSPELKYYDEEGRWRPPGDG